MIKYEIRGENIKKTEAIDNYIRKRFAKLNHYVDTTKDIIIRVNIRKYTEKTFKVEATIFLPFITLRAEETQDDFYSSVDFVSDKILRQWRKYKTRVNRKSREKGFKGVRLAGENVSADDSKKNNNFKVIRRKSLALKPMNTQEAALQMEMLDHDFFLFLNSSTNQLDLLYKRNDGKYGLIETERVENSK